MEGDKGRGLADVLAAADIGSYAESSSEAQADDASVHYVWMLAGAVAVKDALAKGDREDVAHFLRALLNAEPTPDYLEALWEFLRSPRLLEIEPKEPYRYMRAAIGRQAERIRRSREMEDKLWKRRLETQIPSDPEDWPDPASADPLAELLHKEGLEQKRGVIREMFTEGLPPAQERLLRLLLAGSEPAEAVRQAGVVWATFQALQRKARRRRKSA